VIIPDTFYSFLNFSALGNWVPWALKKSINQSINQLINQSIMR